FLHGWFVDWSGYSFASGHTIGATLLYGQLALFILPAMKARHCRRLTVASAALLIALVGFSRIAFGAHFLTDVLGAIAFGLSCVGSNCSRTRDESAGKNPNNCMVAWSCWSRTFHNPTHPARRAPGRRRLRFRRVGHCRRGDLSLRCAGRTRCNCLVGSFSKIQ